MRGGRYNVGRLAVAHFTNALLGEQRVNSENLSATVEAKPDHSGLTMRDSTLPTIQYRHSWLHPSCTDESSSTSLWVGATKQSCPLMQKPGLTTCLVGCSKAPVKKE